MEGFASKFLLLDPDGNQEDLSAFISKENLEYKLQSSVEQGNEEYLQRGDMWRYFNLLPVNNYSNIVSLGEGRTLVKRIPELEKYLNFAQLYCKYEGENPTGTFKDREASYIISKAKELGMKKMACHSTGNTGRAYCRYAKSAGIETFFFLPLSCMEKCDSTMLGDMIHIIAVDGHFNQVSSIAKLFAAKNNIQVVAPMHEKLEGKATIAYEQYEEVPNATIFAQTIAGGYGILGFLLGHKRMKMNGITDRKYLIPRIYALQVDDNCTITTAYQNGLDSISEKDLKLPQLPYEKTLQSTNPLKTFSAVKQAVDGTFGSIESSSIEEVESIRDIFENALRKEGMELSYEDEKSPYISFAGLVKLAKAGKINKEDVIYMVVTGRGRREHTNVEPEAILKPVEGGYDILKTSNYLQNLL